MQKKSKPVLFASLIGLILIASILIIPISFDSRDGTLICKLGKTSAQDNPCLAQQVTIGAQEVKILELQATQNAQALALLQLQTANELLETKIAGAQSSQLVITVPIIVTATPVATEAASSNNLTPAATSNNSQVEIVEVTGAGDLETEGIVIRNIGQTINLEGWELRDSDGNTYVFAERFLFSNALVTLYTRVGQDTAIALFWNQPKSVINKGEQISLFDAEGNLQFTYP